tara:strand:+ start:135 stop:524 length:390 start_codon:yes stop_codon:yes gene_type:complete
MSENFILEIISPDKTLVKKEFREVTIPSFEGQMGILKNHISLVTFLRPGFINAINDKEIEKYFVEDGTVEFSNNTLLILSSTVNNIKNFSREKIEILIKETEENINKENINDKEKYKESHKLDSLREII